MKNNELRKLSGINQVNEDIQLNEGKLSAKVDELAAKIEGLSKSVSKKGTLGRGIIAMGLTGEVKAVEKKFNDLISELEELQMAVGINEDGE